MGERPLTIADVARYLVPPWTILRMTKHLEWAVTWGKNSSDGPETWFDDFGIETESIAWARAIKIMIDGFFVFAIYRGAEKIFDQRDVAGRFHPEAGMLSSEIRAVSSMTTRPHAYVRGKAFGERVQASMGAGCQPSMQSERRRQDQNLDGRAAGSPTPRWNHYPALYDRHLGKFRGRTVTVLVLKSLPIETLRFWEDYLGAGCRLILTNSNESSTQSNGSSRRASIGDESTRSFWQRFKAETPSIDIVIDKGGYPLERRITALEDLLPHLNPGGVYLCEDVYEPINLFHDYLSGLGHQLNVLLTPRDETADFQGELELTALQRAVASIHQYPFVSVIERNDHIMN